MAYLVMDSIFTNRIKKNRKNKRMTSKQNLIEKYKISKIGDGIIYYESKSDKKEFGARNIS